MTHVTVTVDQWNQLLAIIGWLAVAGGFVGAFVFVDWLDRWDRFMWARRRRARLLRRRAKAATNA
ncbi:MAG: hypothetical protein NVV67_16610 [Pseudoxanthomonas sp.]|nr:hypothetical protein [Pseudoxanthomonas sp.]